MARAICIFSDGTGQAGGANPINWTSVYRLFVNTRDVAPASQLCFYDPGLGSDPDVDEEPGLLDRLRGAVSQALGAGITRNIIDCYAALMVTWMPGDRVFLFGFSRGAYTVRSAAGVMALCGVPKGMPKVTRWQEVRDRINDPEVRAIATEAVTQVYQLYGPAEPRQAMAADFRRRHDSRPLPPYFIGVWDTVRALGWQVTNIAAFGRHRFHNAELNPAVDHGRQVLSIDENRKVFAPEIWDERRAPARQIAQVWMAGVHADIGGGYGLKLGLTDLAMRWMVDEAMAARDRVADPERAPGFGGLRVDPNLLAELNLDPLDRQHDERASLSGLLWWPGGRKAFVETAELKGPAVTRPSLPPRFDAPTVVQNGVRAAYRPDAMREHPEFRRYY